MKRIEVCNRFVGSTGSNDFYNQFSRLLQGRFGGHKHLKVLVLKNQQQRWHKPTPNQQMQHFLHYKTDTHLNPQHKVQCNYIDVVYVYNIIINVYMLLAVFYAYVNWPLFDCHRISFPHLFECTDYGIRFWRIKSGIA